MRAAPPWPTVLAATPAPIPLVVFAAGLDFREYYSEAAGLLGLLLSGDLPVGVVPARGRVASRRAASTAWPGQVPGAIAQAETQTQPPSRFWYVSVYRAS
jgi:hypothetical protein